MLIRSFRVFAPAVLATILFASQAHAQASPGLGSVGWVAPLSTDPDATPHVEGTRVPGRWNWNVGFALDVLERPYAARNAAGMDVRLIDYQLWGHLLAQLGLTSRMAVALHLPALLHQQGDLSRLGNNALPFMGFGDVRAVWRYSTRPSMSAPDPSNPNAPREASTSMTGEGPGLAAVVSVTAPSGDPRALTGAGAWQLHPTAVLDFRLFGLLGAIQAGYRARFDEHWPAQTGTCATGGVTCLGGVPIRDAFTWSFALRMPQGLFWNIASLFFEALGSFDMRNPVTPNTTPVELNLGASRVFGEFTASLSAGLGVSDAPGNPRVRGLLMLQWAPRFVDEDNDGLRDNNGEDQCVGLPEDRDGYQDNDGCPEDNDNDEIPDAEDRCPMQDEDVDDFQDDDGCPDPDNDRDGVPDTQDQCRDVSAGNSPDSARAGCPNNDIDGDGINNDEDECPDRARGRYGDTQHRGCPIQDGDNDGVPDSEDACIAEHSGGFALPQQRGCPDPDLDHDGVLGRADRCPGDAETINGVDDEDGCPERSAPGARARVRIRRINPDDPGTVELLEPLAFTATGTIAPTSNALLSQLALAITSASRRPYHVFDVYVPTRAGLNAEQAQRRRVALIGALWERGVPRWALRPGTEAAPPAHHAATQGIVFVPVDAGQHGTLAHP